MIDLDQGTIIVQYIQILYSGFCCESVFTGGIALSQSQVRKDYVKHQTKLYPSHNL